MRKFIQKHYLIIVFLFFFTFVIGFKEIRHVTPFFDWDEAIYAQTGKEMISKLSIVPLWQGKAWLDKPPLVPLLYGIVETVSPMSPEVSTRLFTLFISIIVMSFIYALYYRISKNALVATLTVALASTMPIFLQRVQVVNIDVFLLLGWLGYTLFFENYWLSLFFLAIGVLSKSLLGFYPALIFLLFFTFKLFIKQISFKDYKKKAIAIISQVFILSLWYVVMYFFYGHSFIQTHIFESHFKRVTASIESHFGKRTFYIDLLIEEFGVFMIFVFVGFATIIKHFWKRFGDTAFLLSIFFVPWFVFLNLTKTKIAWYYYPTIPQFAYLASYALVSLKHSAKAYAVASVIFIILIGIKVDKLHVLDSYYSGFEPHYYMSLYAKNNCRGTLHVVIDKDSRTAHDTLEKMNLLISTSTWWGNHASVVYYYGGPVNFIYDVKNIESIAQKLGSNECMVLNETDDKTSIEKIENLKLEKVIAPYLVYRKD